MPLRIDYRPMKLPRDAHRATAPASGRVDNPKAARTRVSTQSPADAQFVPRLMHLPPVRVPGVTLVAAPARAAACPASPMFSRPRDFAARIVRGETTSLLRVLHRPAIWRQRIAGIVTVGLLASVLAPLGWGTPGGIEPAAVSRGRRSTSLRRKTAGFWPRATPKPHGRHSKPRSIAMTRRRLARLLPMVPSCPNPRSPAVRRRARWWRAAAARTRPAPFSA